MYSVPLYFIRDYTIPIGDELSWNRVRAAIAPVTFVFAFNYLNGNLNDYDEIEESFTTTSQF